MHVLYPMVCRWIRGVLPSGPYQYQTVSCRKLITTTPRHDVGAVVMMRRSMPAKLGICPYVGGHTAHQQQELFLLVIARLSPRPSVRPEIRGKGGRPGGSREPEGTA